MILGFGLARGIGRGLWYCERATTVGDAAGDSFSDTGLFGGDLLDGMFLEAFNFASKKALFSLKEVLPLATALQMCSGSGLRVPMDGDGCSNDPDDDFFVTLGG